MFVVGEQDSFSAMPDSKAYVLNHLDLENSVILFFLRSFQPEKSNFPFTLLLIFFYLLIPSLHEMEMITLLLH